MYNHNKAQQSSNRVHISWDILYICDDYQTLPTFLDWLWKDSYICKQKISKLYAIYIRLPRLGTARYSTRIIYYLSLVISWVGVTKAPFANFSVNKIFDLTEVPVRCFVSYSYLAGVIAAELQWHLPNINMIVNSKRVLWWCWKLGKWGNGEDWLSNAYPRTINDNRTTVSCE